MKRIKKLILAMICMCVITLGAGFCVGNVNAMDNTSARSIESYSRSTVIGLQTYGSVDVSVVIKHNMTTGKFYVYNTDYNTHFNTGYGGVGVSAFSTNPAKGQEIKGKVITAKITYYQFGILSETVTGNIYP